MKSVCAIIHRKNLSFTAREQPISNSVFPFGWGELWGIADRTDYDLTQHQNTSGQDLTYFDDDQEREIYSICH